MTDAAFYASGAAAVESDQDVVHADGRGRETADDLPVPFGQVRAFPTTFFIGADGRIRSGVTGYQDFEALQKRALAGAAGR